jgi:Transglutaminase-like superfamily
MIPLTLRAYVLLLSFERAIIHRDFQGLYQRVRGRSIRPVPPNDETFRHASEAIDRACVLYFKPVQCLQRSAATVCLLRRLGAPARLVIGARHLPFQAHAWVEVEGHVINDKLSVTETYRVLDRC